MSAKLKYDVVAVTGKYKDKDGNEKARTMKVGVVLESDKGMSMKLEALPVSPEWDGWLRFYEPKPKTGQQTTAPAAAKPAAAQGEFPPDEDIPF